MTKFFITSFIAVLSFSANSQVGINTQNPNASSSLDVVSNNTGILIPRMTIAQRNLIQSPAEGLLVFDTDRNCLSQQSGTAAAPKWVCISGNVVRFFYLPSINIDTSATGNGLTLDLFQQYKSQFSQPLISSTGAQGIPYFEKPGQLEYYVTDYDSGVLNITSINQNGIMTYNVISSASECSFVNVVLVVKN